MLTIVVLFRNMGRITVDCVQILADTLRSLYLDRAQGEVIFVDDASEPGQEVTPMLRQMREAYPLPVRILRFKTRQHYTRGLAHALSAARGHVLFISHDMLVPRAYIRGVLEVAALDPSFGIIRGVSTYVDVFPQHKVEPPSGVGDLLQLNSFASFVADRWGLANVEDEFLTGDSMLIKREVIDKIGVFDSKFVGYYGDRSVTSALYTPLRSVTNAISSVIVVGALLAVGVALASNDSGPIWARALGFVALMFASVNIFGGFLVTQRMLSMFHRKEKK